jgi:hypothetical protein
MAAMFVVNYLWEVKTFHRVLRAVGDEIEQGDTSHAQGVGVAHNKQMQRTRPAQALEPRR